MRQQRVHKGAMDGVERMHVQHRFDLGTAVGQRFQRLQTLLVQFIGIDQQKFAIGPADQRHMGADVENLGDPEIATDIPEVVRQMFDGRVVVR